MAVQSRTPGADDGPATIRVVRRYRAARRPEPVPKPPPRVGVSVLAHALAFREAIADPAIGNRAGLARRLGVSRAHITQAMAVLEAPMELRVAIEAADRAGHVVGERLWRRMRAAELPDALALLGAAESTRKADPVQCPRGCHGEEAGTVVHSSREDVRV